jgi:hypothetical protein
MLSFTSMFWYCYVFILLALFSISDHFSSLLWIFQITLLNLEYCVWNWRSQFHFRTILRDMKNRKTSFILFWSLQSTNERFVGLSGIWIRIFGYLDCRAPIEWVEHPLSYRVNWDWLSRKYFVHLNWIRPIPVDSIAQWIEQQSRYPKMQVQIPLEPTNFSLVDCSIRIIWNWFFWQRQHHKLLTKVPKYWTKVPKY